MQTFNKRVRALLFAACVGLLCCQSAAHAQTPAEAPASKDDDPELVCDTDECDAKPLAKEKEAAAQPQPRIPDEALDAPDDGFHPLRRLLANKVKINFLDHTITLGASGRISQAVLWGDNQEDTKLFWVDNNSSSTRINGTADLPLSEQLRIGVRTKLPLIVNSSIDVNFDNRSSDNASDQFGESEFDFYLAHSDYGRISIGQGYTASNGTSESDLSGLTVISRSRVRDLAGGLSFGDDGPRIRNVFSNYDGLGDKIRVRYDTPRVRNVLISTSLTDDGEYDIALKWEKRQETWRAAAAASLVDRDGGDEQASLSFSVLFENGFNMSAAVAGRHSDERDPFLLYAKAGWLVSPFEIGATAFGVDAAYNDSVDSDGDEAWSVGAFAVQTIDRKGLIYSVDLYAGLRLYHLETDTYEYDNIFASMTGIRIRF